MIALAFGPGSGVFSDGTVITPGTQKLGRNTRSFSLPARAGGIVLEKHAPCREVVADAIGGGKTAAAPRRVATLDQLLDLVDRNGRLRVFGLPRAAPAEAAVEDVERVFGDRHIAGADRAGV